MVGRKTGSLLLAAALISASEPQILGNPELISCKMGKLGDCAIAGIIFLKNVRNCVAMVKIAR